MFLRLLLLAIFLSACGVNARPSETDGVFPTPDGTETGGAPSSAPCDFGGTWSVNLLVSGGLAGVQQELLLSSDGQASYTDRSGSLPTTWTLGTEDLQELQRLLETACPFESQVSRPSSCRDCFVYRLEIVSGQDRFLWEADESQVVDEAFRSLLAYLEAIRSRAT
jgi:hypothetical protein